MWKDSIRNIVVIFQPNVLRIVGFYVRHSAIYCLCSLQKSSSKINFVKFLKIKYRQIRMMLNSLGHKGLLCPPSFLATQLAPFTRLEEKDCQNQQHYHYVAASTFRIYEHQHKGFKMVSPLFSVSTLFMLYTGAKANTDMGFSNKILMFSCTNCRFRFRWQKNQPLLIYSSRCSRDSQEPKTKIIFQFWRGLFQKIPFFCTFSCINP